MTKIKVSAVSYLNTKPFLLGLEKTGLINQIDLSLDIPSQTAQKLQEKSVELALVPVAVLPFLENYEIVTDYCIGTTGKVRTVALYSACPLSEIKTVLLDYHSRTSVQLVQFLFREYWRQEVVFVAAKESFEHDISGTTAGLIIGDRTIKWEKKLPYAYDLGEMWVKHTGLPFVFAAWVATRPLSSLFLQQLNEAFGIGMSNMDEVVALHENVYDASFDLKYYLTKNISFDLDEEKRKGLDLFLTYIRANELMRHDV